MPPRKGIVRSGNAGNSSKAPKPVVLEKKGKGGDGDVAALAQAPPRPPPLFPMGYKTPLAILSEKCQKNGWEKPVVDTRGNPHSEPQTFNAVVTLKKRKNKNLTDFDVVRMMPMPRIEATDSLMARHLGATYALFRFCSNLPMSMLLPPSIRPYWTTLQAEKSFAEEHRAWEWAEDPFLAQKEVQARQERRAAKQSAQQHADGLDHGVEGRSGSSSSGGRGGGGMWKSAPEVKMTPSQRELVESVIRKMMRQYPAAVLEAARESGATPSAATLGSATPSMDLEAVEHQLKQLDFRPAHIKSCLRAMDSAYSRLHSGSTSRANDPLALSLSFLSPLEAAIEYLLAHLPEDDLPRAYRPASNVADFVSDVVGPGGGQEGLRRAWLVDKLVKKAGFPRKAVEEIVAQESRQEVALDLLGRRLCGWLGEDGGWSVAEYGTGWESTDEAEDQERTATREEEITVLSSILDSRVSRSSDEEFVVTVSSTGTDTVDIHFLFGSASPYPSARYPNHPPTFYLSSAKLPAYIRLHLHAEMLRAFRDTDRPEFAATLEGGMGGACYLLVELLESRLQLTLDSPPDVDTVTQHLVPTVEMQEAKPAAAMQRTIKRQRNRQTFRAPTTEQQEAVMQQYRTMKTRPGYDAMIASRSKLPAWGNRVEINDLLASNRVVIVVGETGSGKTTQIPQFILDHEIENGRGAATTIVVTQPRRVSALGVAGRVAEERMENIDRTVETVGYAIRGETKLDSRRTRLSFVTTGVILRRLGTGDADLAGISHIVVDEVHERSVDGDFLLLQLKELLGRNSTIKVVLMSATINQQTFIDYFDGAPLLEIPGFTHPVQDRYLEDYLPELSYKPEPPRYKQRLQDDERKSLRDDLDNLNLDTNTRQILETLASSTSIPYDLIAAICQQIVAKSQNTQEGILIFLPGVAEIKNTVQTIEQCRLPNCQVIPLHANLSSAEQKRVFAKISSRKIVVATNVAETSITISEIVYVVDSGKLKETQFDPETSLSKLVETYTSRAASRQRRGRAGRTQPGVCYKLFTRRTEKRHMAPFAVPEILRTPLESLFLQVKAMSPDEDVKSYLLRAIDPPKMEAMDAAWKTLVDLGAVQGEEQTSRLTALGRHMSIIPVDLRLGKMLVLGCVFRALDPILTIAAMLSSKPLFAGPMEKREEMKRAREKFAWAKSDILLNLRAYQAASGIRGQSALRSFCEENFISWTTMRDITSLRQDFVNALSDLGYVHLRQLELLNVNAENENLLKAIFTGGMYPRVAQIRPPDAKFEQLQSGTLQKDHEARELKFFDQSGRVFLHPGSILFAESNLKAGYLAYFHKAETSKTFLFDATEIPLFALLLFGGPVTINHFAGGVMVGKEGHIRLRAWARIGILVNQLRRLLDARLSEAIEDVEAGGSAALGENDDVVRAMLGLLA